MFKQLAEALREMEQTINDRPVPFSVSFWTADRQANTGGKLIELVNVTLPKKQNLPINTAPAGTDSEKVRSGRRANHYTNATRNFLLPNGQIRKAHIRLIHTYNGQEVHW